MACCLAAIVSPASAQTTQPALTASLGFSGIFKPESWTPMYVRMSDADAPRRATIELRVARGKIGHEVSAAVTTARGATTYTLYAPPIGNLDRVFLQLRNAKGGLLGAVDLTDVAASTPAALGGPAIGIAGPDAEAQRVANQLEADTDHFAAVGTLAPALLPERTIGYQSLDCLVLPALDADAIDDGIQRAIVSWVRAGGIVVTWPGATAPTRADAPLVAALPADIGLPEAFAIDDINTVGRRLTPREGAARVDPGLVVRKLGLGHIALFATDPTRLQQPPERRLDLWRRLTVGQLAFTADERRAGVFDPLVATAVAEQQLAPAIVPSRLWRDLALAVLVLGILLGPGELILLAAARRHPRTPYTLVGLGLVVVGGATLLLLPRRDEIDARRIDVRVETPDGLASSAGLLTTPTSDLESPWLAVGQTAPGTGIAAELSLRQRGHKFEAANLVRVSGASPRVRSIRFAGETLHPTHIAFDVATGRVANATQERWDAIAIVTRDSVAIGTAAISAGEAVETHSLATTSADDPSTRRRETGIEKLAAQKGWEPILLDRHQSERLVRLLETEPGTRVIVVRREGGRGFVVQVVR